MAPCTMTCTQWANCKCTSSVHEVDCTKRKGERCVRIPTIFLTGWCQYCAKTAEEDRLTPGVSTLESSEPDKYPNRTPSQCTMSEISIPIDSPYAASSTRTAHPALGISWNPDAWNNEQNEENNSFDKTLDCIGNLQDYSFTFTSPLHPAAHGSGVYGNGQSTESPMQEPEMGKPSPAYATGDLQASTFKSTLNPAAQVFGGIGGGFANQNQSIGNSPENGFDSSTKSPVSLLRRSNPVNLDKIAEQANYLGSKVYANVNTEKVFAHARAAWAHPERHPYGQRHNTAGLGYKESIGSDWAGWGKRAKLQRRRSQRKPQAYASQSQGTSANNEAQPEQLDNKNFKQQYVSDQYTPTENAYNYYTQPPQTNGQKLDWDRPFQPSVDPNNNSNDTIDDLNLGQLHVSDQHYSTEKDSSPAQMPQLRRELRPLADFFRPATTPEVEATSSGPITKEKFGIKTQQYQLRKTYHSAFFSENASMLSVSSLGQILPTLVKLKEVIKPGKNHDHVDEEVQRVLKCARDGNFTEMANGLDDFLKFIQAELRQSREFGINSASGYEVQYAYTEVAKVSGRLSDMEKLL